MARVKAGGAGADASAMTVSDRSDETARLDAITASFSSDDGLNARIIDYRFDAIAPFLTGASSCVELGCADGRMTRRLAAAVADLTAVDGALEYVEAVRASLPEITAVHSLFEHYEPGRRFDTVVLGHVLEHVADPVALLARVRGLLAPGGRALLTVPNANSIHREVGVALGILASVTELGEADVRIGHRRVYTRESLVADVHAAGLAVEHVDGVFLKPLSNGQIERDWSDELIDAFNAVGRRHPEICAELLVVAR